jgi:hypothetical protein
MFFTGQRSSFILIHCRRLNKRPSFGSSVVSPSAVFIDILSSLHVHSSIFQSLFFNLFV